EKRSPRPTLGQSWLLSDSLWKQPCRLSLTDPKRRPLTAPTLVRFSPRWNSVDLITSLSPGGGEKMSKHAVRSGDVAGLRMRFSQLKDKVQVRMGQVVPIIVIRRRVWTAFGSSMRSILFLMSKLQQRRTSGGPHPRAAPETHEASPALQIMPYI